MLNLMQDTQAHSNTMNRMQNHVHIWHASYSKAAFLEYRFASVLSLQEEERAHRLIDKVLQERFIYAHAMLRHLLASYLVCDAKTIVFAKTSFGKPYIAHPRTTLQFNLSHAHDYIMIAIHEKEPVGVDVEKIQKDDVLKIARRFFAKEEYEALLNIDGQELRQQFYTFWTCKEAILKGAGFGIATFLATCKLQLPLDDQIVFVNNMPWRVRTIPVPSDYVSALATRPHIENIQHFSYHDFLKDGPDVTRIFK